MVLFDFEGINTFDNELDINVIKQQLVNMAVIKKL